MKRDKIEVIIGVVIILTSISGLPRDWKIPLFILSGVAIVFFATRSIMREIKLKDHEKPNDTFVESRPTDRIRSDYENSSSSHIADA